MSERLYAVEGRYGNDRSWYVLRYATTLEQAELGLSNLVEMKEAV